MKATMTSRMMGMFYFGVTKKGLRDRGVTNEELKAIKAEYKAVVHRAKDIGKAVLLSSYLMAAYFIAMNRGTRLSADDCYAVLHDGLMGSKVFKKMMGDADSYFDPRRTAKRKEWSSRSKEKQYANDWVVDVLDATEDYELGYDYHECGVCKLCQDEGCPEWASYLCRLDFPMAEMMGMRLVRTKTLADGGDMCDFRYSRLDK